MYERRRRDVLTPLVAAMAVILVLAYLVFRPFLLDFAVAIAMAVLLAPAQHRLSVALGQRRGLAATVIVFVTTLVIFVPVLFSLVVLTRQALAFLAWALPYLDPDQVKRFWTETLPARFPAMEGWILRTQGPLSPLFSTVLTQIVSAANAVLQGLVGGVTRMLFDLAVFLVTLFFLLKDGPRLKAELRPISPFTEAQEHQIFDHLDKTVKASLQAMIMVPVLQGLVAGLGFLLFGVPSPIVWGTGVILAAMVPVLGSPLGWVPAVVYLFLIGEIWASVGLFVYSLVLVSGIDNVVKPMILQGGAQIHPLLGFLSILGGVLAFGFHGFLVGPAILSLVLSAIRIYRLDVVRGATVAAASDPTLSDSAKTA